MAETSTPTARVEMLIRKPASEIYRAFVEPTWLSRFWLSRASAPLAVDRDVEWEFMVPGAKTTTRAKALDPDRRILVELDDGTTVEWTFEGRADGATRVLIEHKGFSGSAAAAVATAIESTQGFTIVLCDLKVLLELQTSPNLVHDKALLIHEQMGQN
jgi:uncharacterized protein YndB with AHSA1/START domain